MFVILKYYLFIFQNKDLTIHALLFSTIHISVNATVIMLSFHYFSDVEEFFGKI